MDPLVTLYLCLFLVIMKIDSLSPYSHLSYQFFFYYVIDRKSYNELSKLWISILIKNSYENVPVFNLLWIIN